MTITKPVVNSLTMLLRRFEHDNMAIHGQPSLPWMIYYLGAHFFVNIEVNCPGLFDALVLKGCLCMVGSQAPVCALCRPSL